MPTLSMIHDSASNAGLSTAFGLLDCHAGVGSVLVHLPGRPCRWPCRHTLHMLRTKQILLSATYAVQHGID